MCRRCLSARLLAQITLQGTRDSGDIVISRRISRADAAKGDKDKAMSRSQWKINDELASAEAVAGIMEFFSIQMNNPCMFLPQEKIGNFTQQAPKEVRERDVGREALREGSS